MSRKPTKKPMRKPAKKTSRSLVRSYMELMKPPKTSVWQEKGATMSEKNALVCYRLTVQQLRTAYDAGQLQFRERWMFGSQYCVYIRAELRALSERLEAAAAAEAKRGTENAAPAEEAPKTAPIGDAQPTKTRPAKKRSKRAADDSDGEYIE